MLTFQMHLHQTNTQMMLYTDLKNQAAKVHHNLPIFKKYTSNLIKVTL